MSADNESEALLPVSHGEEQTTSLNSFKVTTKMAVAGVVALGLLTLGLYSMPETDSTGAPLTKTTELYVGNKYTRYSGHNANSNQIIFLDRHNVDCGNDFLNFFKGHGAFQYQYKCMSSGGLANVRRDNRATGYAWGGQHNLNFLDRQNVYCPSNMAMTRFKMNTISHYRFRYDFSCGIGNWASLSCSNHGTGWNTYQNMHYLDRHTIDCGDKVLQGFDVDSHTFREVCGRYWWWGWRNRYCNVNKIKYNYRCCSMIDSSPTPVPTAKPIADPTAQPTADPTANPVADPTAAPTINETPLVCKMTFDKTAAEYTEKVPVGCALVSTEDIGWEKFSGNAPGVMVCGSAEVADFKKAGLNTGISYIYTSKSMTATTYTEANYKGTKHYFGEGMPSVVHDHNDEVHSIQFVSSAHDEGVPTECSLGVKVEGVASPTDYNEELNEHGEDAKADAEAEKEANAIEA